MSVPPDANAAAAAAPAYRRLPGRAFGLLGRSSLWQGPDHALQVQLRGYSEVYRRFYFRDIQALVLRRTRSALLLAIVLAAVCALLWSAALLSDAPGSFFWGALGALFALWLLVHAARGPSCVCHVRTAVETTELVALRRLRPARRSLEHLRVLIEAAQGAVTAEQLQQPAGVAADPPPAVPAPAAQIAESTPPSLPGTDGLRRHRTLALLLLADSVLSAFQLAIPSRVLDILGLVLAVAEFLVAVFALVEGRRRGLDRRLGTWTRAALAYVSATFVVVWFASIYNAIEKIVQRANPGEFVMPGTVHWLEIACVPLTLVLGVIGLVLLRRARAAR